MTAHVVANGGDTHAWRCRVTPFSSGCPQVSRTIVPQSHDQFATKRTSDRGHPSKHEAFSQSVFFWCWSAVFDVGPNNIREMPRVCCVQALLNSSPRTIVWNVFAAWSAANIDNSFRWDGGGIRTARSLSLCACVSPTPCLLACPRVDIDQWRSRVVLQAHSKGPSAAPRTTPAENVGSGCISRLWWASTGGYRLFSSSTACTSRIKGWWSSYGFGCWACWINLDINLVVIACWREEAVSCATWQFQVTLPGLAIDAYLSLCLSRCRSALADSLWSLLVADLSGCAADSTHA